MNNIRLSQEVWEICYYDWHVDLEYEIAENGTAEEIAQAVCNEACGSSDKVSIYHAVLESIADYL